MCGLVGFFSKTRPDAKVIKKMSDSIAYRGPDADGHYLDEINGIAFGHRRLSIIDLTATGAQPMRSRSGRFVITFNGEIYNHLALRTELNTPFRGSSDTETLLEAIAHWGIEQTLKKCAGMFAFALWDNQEKCLFLARDRLGEKPLYYGIGRQDTFFFASELKALWAHPDWIGELDEASSMSYLRYGYVPAPASIFKGIYKLPPAHFLKWSGAEKNLELNPYWTLDQNHETLSEKSAIECTEATLKKVIREQMIADVSVGAFLSGGIDSSLVAVLMQELSPRPIRTFTIAFQDNAYNEAPIAAEVAKHIGSDHQELQITANHALDIVPKLGSIYDEPFADSSQIPTVLLAELTKKFVTVSLSGDGGDELFAGYNRYLYAPKLWGKLCNLPLISRQLASHLMLGMPGSVLHTILPQLSNASLPIDKYYKLAKLVRAKNASEVYLDLTSLLDPHEFLNYPESRKYFMKESVDFVRSMQTEDLLHYLPDDILVKLDRACMSASLEGRAPLLDYRLLEVARKIPSTLHLKDGKGKWILRNILYKRMPQTLFERPKTGFTAPIGEWLRGELRAWAEHLLFQVEAPLPWNLIEVRRIWQEHQTGKRDWQHQLWVFLMFQVWWETYQTKMKSR